MKYIKFTTLFIICFFLCQQKAFSQDWLKEIAPYQMTVNEVEKLISVTSVKNLSGKDYRVYLLKEGRLEIDFSLGRCVDGRYGKWELEKGVIMETRFYPNKMKKITYYEKDIKGLNAELGTGLHKGLIVYYEDVVKGIGYTMQAEMVKSITLTGLETIDVVKCKE